MTLVLISTTILHEDGHDDDVDDEVYDDDADDNDDDDDVGDDDDDDKNDGNEYKSTQKKDFIAEKRTSKLNRHMASSPESNPGHVGGKRGLKTLRQAFPFPTEKQKASLILEKPILLFQGAIRNNKLNTLLAPQ